MEIYYITYTGGEGDGWGVLALQDGLVRGVDVGGCKYMGTYTTVNDRHFIEMEQNIPIGVSIVQGFPAQDYEWHYPISINISTKADADEDIIALITPFGTINVRISLLL